MIDWVAERTDRLNRGSICSIGLVGEDKTVTIGCTDKCIESLVISSDEINRGNGWIISGDSILNKLANIPEIELFYKHSIRLESISRNEIDDALRIILKYISIRYNFDKSIVANIDRSNVGGTHGVLASPEKIIPKVYTWGCRNFMAKHIHDSVGNIDVWFGKKPINGVSEKAINISKNSHVSTKNSELSLDKIKNHSRLGRIVRSIRLHVKDINNEEHELKLGDVEHIRSSVGFDCPVEEIRYVILINGGRVCRCYGPR